MSADTSSEPHGESSWSLRADWTEPVKRQRTAVVLAGGVVLALLAWRIGWRADLAAFAYLACAGTVLGAVDISMKRLPDPLTLPSYPIGMALLAVAVPFTPDGGSRFVGALIGLAVLWTFFAVQWFFVSRAPGLGDVKLAGVLGLYLGWLGYEAWTLGVAAIVLMAAAYAIVLLVLKRPGRTTMIPYGPFMLAGTLVGVLVHP